MTEETSSAFDVEPLDAIQMRALGSLIEKQLTTPETYPLTLNALVLASNQKTSREPLMNVTPGEAGGAMRALEERGLARLVMGSRADRWEQRVDKALSLVPPQLPLIGLLLLRGPQTLAELLTRSSRMHAFDDAEEVRHQLDRLAGRGLVRQLPRQPGQREDRYAQLLGGSDAIERWLADQPAASARVGSATVSQDRLEALEARIAALEARLVDLEARLEGA